MTTEATHQSVTDWVLDRVEEYTDADGELGQNENSDTWTSTRSIAAGGEKFSVPYSKDQIQAAVDRLVEDTEVVEWHGLIAPATDKHLASIIEAEREASVTRKLLVGHVNTVRQEVGSCE